MRRLIITLLIITLLTTTVFAAGSVQELQSSTVASQDGSCEVTVTVQLRLDESPSDPTFPVPAKAMDISLNGKRVYPTVSGNVRRIDLKDVIPGAGICTFVIRYTLENAVSADSSDRLNLKLDLLSGFAYPIEKATFSVTLPGAPASRPALTSTYYQEAIDALMEYTVTDNTITCSFEGDLKDHETLTLTLPVTKAMFPQSMTMLWRMGTDDVAIILCAVLAFVYWIFTMRNAPPRRGRRAKNPEGITAGELGCCLTGEGMDLTVQVLCWAQMGYLLLQLDDNGRVLLHKRMDMGNERSDWEVRFFRSLFGKRKTVDATGLHYARLYRKAASFHPHIRNYYRSNSGNPLIFRILCAAVGLFGGISLASSFAVDTLATVLLAIPLAIAGCVAAWLIQSAAGVIHLRHWRKLLLGIGCSGIWLLLGILAKEAGIALIVVLIQWLSGLMRAYGGRRSQTGQQLMSQILGLRRHMRQASTETLLLLQERNPDYYYSLAPYALALGVDRLFARHFGDCQLPECDYLTTGMDGHLTPAEWNQLLREAVSSMDKRQRRLPWEKFFGK